jgi:uncharacterized membrane protein
MEFEEKVKLLKKARTYWTWGLLVPFSLFLLLPIIGSILSHFPSISDSFFPLIGYILIFFIPIIGFILRYLGVRLVAKATNNYKISRYYGLSLLLCFIPFISFLLIAESLLEAGKELNNIWFIKADKWYGWTPVGLFIGIGVFFPLVGWVYEVQGVWHIHEISEEMNSSEIVRKEE